MRVGLDVQGLIDASGLPERTTRYAVRWLVDAGLARRVTPLRDTRRSIVVAVQENRANSAHALEAFA